MSSYPSSVPLVTDGNPVNSANDSLPILALAARTDFLLQLAEDGQWGETLYAFAVPAETALTPGMAVYLGSDGTYYRAELGVTVTGGRRELASSAWVAGLVVSKPSANVATLMTCGYYTYLETDLTAVWDGTVTAGPVFLGDTPGHLTSTATSVALLVGYVSGPNVGGTGYRRLQFVNAAHNLLADHGHVKVQLAMTLTTTAPVAGWVAAANTALLTTLFPGVTPPAGFTHGYNWKADSTLSSIFPLAAMTTPYLERNGRGIRIDGTTAECVIDTNGIWWKCATKTPLAGANAAVDGGCAIADQLFLWLTMAQGASTEWAVSSLTPADDTVTLLSPSGVAAVRGPLTISAKPHLVSGTATGYQVCKPSGSDNRSIKLGTVLEGLAVTGNASLAGGTACDDAGDTLSETHVGGRPTLHVPNPYEVMDSTLDAVTLDNVLIQDTSGIEHYIFPQSSAGYLEGRLRVPEFTGSMAVVFDIWILSKLAATLPSLTLYTALMSKPDPGVVTSLPTLATGTLTFPATGSLSDLGAVAVNSFVRVLSSQFTVTPGALVILGVQRPAPDGYAADLGIIDIRWRLVEVTLS